MSRRFGRNQRRRAREALAASEQSISDLETAMTLDRALLRDQGRRLREYEYFQRDVVDLVGREAVIAGEPTTLDLKWDERDGDRIHHAPYQPLTMARIIDRSWQDSYAVRDEVLRLLQVETVAEPMRQQVHARVTLADERVGYAISESALQRLSRDQIRKAIGEPMLRMLVDALMKRRQR